MDKLVKAKRITMRDFLLEVLIIGHKNNDPSNLTKLMLCDRAAEHGYIRYSPIRLTRSGQQFIDKWKDLV